jgi:hypothetical protein
MTMWMHSSNPRGFNERWIVDTTKQNLNDDVRPYFGDEIVLPSSIVWWNNHPWHDLFAVVARSLYPHSTVNKIYCDGWSATQLWKKWSSLIYYQKWFCLVVIWWSHEPMKSKNIPMNEVLSLVYTCTFAIKSLSKGAPRNVILCFVVLHLYKTIICLPRMSP